MAPRVTSDCSASAKRATDRTTCTVSLTYEHAGSATEAVRLGLRTKWEAAYLARMVFSFGASDVLDGVDSVVLHVFPIGRLVQLAGVAGPLTQEMARGLWQVDVEGDTAAVKLPDKARLRRYLQHLGDGLCAVARDKGRSDAPVRAAVRRAESSLAGHHWVELSARSPSGRNEAFVACHHTMKEFAADLVVCDVAGRREAGRQPVVRTRGGFDFWEPLLGRLEWKRDELVRLVSKPSSILGFVKGKGWDVRRINRELVAEVRVLRDGAAVERAPAGGRKRDGRRKSARRR